MIDAFISGALAGSGLTLVIVFRAEIKRSVIVTLTELGFLTGVDDD